jgi:hypothetical protein
MEGILAASGLEVAQLRSRANGWFHREIPRTGGSRSAWLFLGVKPAAPLGPRVSRTLDRLDLNEHGF